MPTLLVLIHTLYYNPHSTPYVVVDLLTPSVRSTLMDAFPAATHLEVAQLS